MRNLTILTISLAALVACNKSIETTGSANQTTNLSTAEAFIDAFYSFNPARLKSFLNVAEESAPAILYYQGWAEGGNYEIVDRRPCEMMESHIISCSITVRDDAMLALGSDFHVTDTFKITFTNSHITSVTTSSNDLKVYDDAANWVRNELSELVRLPCQGFFDGGPTPGACARAMAEGYARFAESDDFPPEDELMTPRKSEDAQD